MANKLNPELVQNIAELTNVKKISDLPIINVIDKDNETETIRTSQQFNNSYILSSTLFTVVFISFISCTSEIVLSNVCLYSLYA